MDPSPTARRGTLHSLSADVANREESGKARFKRVGRPVQRPTVLNLCTGLDEALCVECETFSKLFRVRVGAGQHKNMLHVPCFARSSLGIVQVSTTFFLRTGERRGGR
jgi:hypothetical protein